jgi:hypothetical protein
MEQTMIKIPYGVSNFKAIIEDGSLYIDKTSFIELLENKYKYISFLRPRRFGKSLFVSTLHYYYDEQYKNIWNDLFKDTYIGKNPTKERSSYKVLFLEFSGIETKNLDTIYRDFNSKIDILLRSYLEKYKYPEKLNILIENKKSPQNKMEAFFEIVKDDKIYLLIDEYDMFQNQISLKGDSRNQQSCHFANSILGESLETFKSILSKGGFVRSFYEVIKTATMSGVVGRVFITGVTPITMDTMTSGFNIILPITNDKNFNELAGFTMDETKTVLTHLFNECPKINSQKLVEDMVKLYNGYKFNVEAKNKIFNSTMVMFFVLNFDTESCKYPRTLLDVNVASDYRKIMQLFQIGDSDKNYEILNELIKTKKVSAVLKEKIEFDKGFTRDDFVTLIYSLGFITINDAFMERIEFIIPNYTIEILYFEYFKIELENRAQISFNTEKIKDSIYQFALNRNFEKLQNEILEVIKLLSNRDFMKFDEKHLKIIMLMIFNTTRFYHIKSEPEYNHKYPDIMLLEQKPYDAKYQFLFELKWAKKTAPKSDPNSWDNKKNEGIEQIKGYLELDDIKNIEGPPLFAYLIIADGERVEIVKV